MPEAVDDANSSLSATDDGLAAISVTDDAGANLYGTFGEAGWTFGEDSVRFGGTRGAFGEDDESAEINITDLEGG